MFKSEAPCAVLSWTGGKMIEDYPPNFFMKQLHRLAPSSCLHLFKRLIGWLPAIIKAGGVDDDRYKDGAF